MPSILLCLPIVLPLLGALGALMIRFPTTRLRNGYLLAVTLLTTASVWILVLFPPREALVILHFTDVLDFSLRLDGAGRIFAGLSSVLWPLTLVYAFSYMQHHGGGLRIFYTFFTASFGVTVGIAFAGNMLTMYLFYELLTLSTIPLIMADARRKAAAAATRKYMIYSFGGAALVFAAVSFLIYCDANEFALGGTLTIVEGQETLSSVMFLLAFLGFGVKAAIFPLHDWLPTASVAPTPVTALLHAVAVVKAGAFAVIRLIYYSYGTDLLKGTALQYAVMGLSLFSLLFASSMALKQTHLKRRLAFSTISNLSYILFAASVMSEAGLIAAFLHLVFHSCMKMPAFLSAGAVLTVADREFIRDMEGLGRKMPLTFAVFGLCGLSLAGIPPFSGFFSKWSIAMAAIASENPLAVVGVAVLLVSALFTAIYMFSVAARAFFPRKEAPAIPDSIREAPALMTVPMLILTVVTLIFGLFGGSIASLFSALLIG